MTEPGFTSELYQLVGSNDLCQLQGAVQPYQAYTPENLLIGKFNGVTPRGFNSPVLPHGIVVWTWTLPLPRPVFLYEQRQDGGVAGQFDENHVLDSNVVTYTVDYRWHQETVDGIITDYYKVKSSVGDVVLFDSGEEEIATPQGVFPLTPVFRSAYSGEYQLSLSQNGTFIRSENYRQKGLEFDTTFPEIETTTGDPPDPIHITNSFHWDDFSSLADPAWRAFVEVTGVGATKNFGDTGQKPGANIDFTWSPADLLLAAARGTLPRSLRLLPRAQCPYGCCGSSSRSEIQSREAQDAPVYPYTVEASDSAYAGIRYQTLRGGILPGQRLLLVLEPRVTPETLDPEPEEVTVRYSARLAAIGFNTSPSIDWRLHLKEKATGTIVRTFTPAESTGASIRFVHIEWDGKIGGQPVSAGEYEFQLVADACESGGSDGGGVDVSDARMFRPREGDPGPCVLAESEVAWTVQGGVSVAFDPLIIKPSFLFNASGEALDPPPSPGAIPGENPGESKLDGKLSTTVIVLRASRPPTRNLVLRITTEAGSGGHKESGSRPTGVLLLDGLNFANSKQLREYFEANPIETSEIAHGIAASSFEGHTEVRIPMAAPFAAGRAVARLEYADGNRELLSSDILFVQVDGLQEVGTAFQSGELSNNNDNTSDGIALRFGATTAHPDNHYGTPEFNAALVSACRRYNQRIRNLYAAGYPSVPRLSGRPTTYDPRVVLSDMSLENGGLFGIRATTFLPALTGDRGHWEHRLGTNVDIITESIDRGINVSTRTPTRDRLLENCLHERGFQVYNEIVRSPEEPHYHLRF